MLGEDLPQLRPAQATAPISLDEIVLKLPSVQTRGSVEEGPLDRGDWNPRLDRRVLGGKRPGLVQPDTVGPTMPGDASHLDRFTRSPYPPELGGASVGDHGSRPTSKSSRHQLAVVPDAPMAKCEDTAVERNQLAVPDPTLDQAFGQAKVDQLPPSDHTVLPLSQLAKNQGRPPRCNALGP